MHLVNQALAKILSNDVDTATNANVLACGRYACSLQCGINAFSNEVESRSSVHDQ